jgi:hypothetical protein
MTQNNYPRTLRFAQRLEAGIYKRSADTAALKERLYCHRRQAKPLVNVSNRNRAKRDMSDKLMIVPGDKGEEWLGAPSQCLDKICFCGSAESSLIHLIDLVDVFELLKSDCDHGYLHRRI